MNVQILTHTPEQIIGEAATICYSSQYRTGLVKDLVHKHKHLSVLRMAFVVIKVSDISRACANQMVRSKHLDFLQESQRYVDQSDRGFVKPDLSYLEDHFNREATEIIEIANSQIQALYTALRQLKVKKEDARAILPMNTMTSLVVSGNLQAWSDFLKLRINPHAQSEINDVAIEIQAQLRELYPEVF